MELSVVITTKNRFNDLIACIDSIKNAEINVEWELIIIDDNSKDETKKIRADKLRIKNCKVYHSNVNLMLVKARNIGAAQSTGNFVLFIDDDNIIDRKMISILCDSMKDIKNDTYGILGPVMYYYDTRLKALDYQRIDLLTGRTISVNLDQYSICESDGVPNVFMVRKEVFDNVGYFDEKLIQTYTEPDMSFQAMKKGYLTGVVQNAKTYHKISKNGKFNSRKFGGNHLQKAYCLMRNRAVIVKRYGNDTQIFFYRYLFSNLWLIIYLLIGLKNMDMKAVRNYYMGYRDGMKYIKTDILSNSLLRIDSK